MMISHPLRRPIFAIFAAIAVVVIAVALLSPKITIRTFPEQPSMTERVMLEPNSAPIQPKLAVRIPVANASESTTHKEPVQLARIGTVTMYVADVNRAVDRVSSIARNVGGDVLSLQVGGDDSKPGQTDADVNVRMPSTRFDDVMNALASAGNISRRSITAQDVSADITDSSARLRNLRHTETDILRIMNRSGSVDDVMSAEGQLSSIREQIETLESQLRDLRTRVVYATIDVTIIAESTRPQIEPSAGAQIASAFTSALQSAVRTAIALATGIVWLAVYLPYAAVAGVCVYIAYRRLRARIA